MNIKNSLIVTAAVLGLAMTACESGQQEGAATGMGTETEVSETTETSEPTAVGETTEPTAVGETGEAEEAGAERRPASVDEAGGAQTEESGVMGTETEEGLTEETEGGSDY